jgi:hypothetical protein
MAGADHPGDGRPLAPMSRPIVRFRTPPPATIIGGPAFTLIGGPTFTDDNTLG